MRRGWTLHEMLISLGVMSLVLGIVAQVATQQLRFFRGVGEVVALRGQIGQASVIATRVFWGVSSAAGDIVVARDSAVELHEPIGIAVVCASTPGYVTFPAPTVGNTLAAFVETPDAGDRIAALFEDSLGATWLTLRAASVPAPGPGCIGLGAGTATRQVALHEQLTVPVGAPLRFTRPLRLSLYRAGDGRWYLGARTWNATEERFNTIQPVAGPLRPYSSAPGSSGFHLTYLDRDGAALQEPVETTRIASVTVVARAEARRGVRVPGLRAHQTGSFEDSATVSVAVRNSR